MLDIRGPGLVMMEPIVSVVTPAYNAARYIGQTIESVLAQSFSSWEMIVVDDCSRDATRRIVGDYARMDGRIRPIPLSKNVGPARARNVALEAAVGRYVAFLDCDDIWLHDKLEKQLAFMQRYQVAFSYTLFRRMSEDGRIVGLISELPESFDYRLLLKNTGIGCLTVMIDREQTGQLQMPDVKHEDYALWLSLLRQGFIAYGLLEDLARYRVVEGSVSRGVARSVSWVWKVYMREGLGLVDATWCLLNYAVRAYRKRGWTSGRVRPY